MENFSLVALSFLIFIFVQASIYLYKRASYIYFPRSEYISEAGVSRLFIPRMDSHIGERCHLVIFSGDGYYHTHSKGFKWLKKLEDWAGRGCLIDYIITAPHSDGLEKYIEISSRQPNFRVFDGSKAVASSECGDLIAKYVTFHPCYLETSNGDYLWIEESHPVGDSHAYGINFWVPKDSSKFNRLSDVKADVSFITNCLRQELFCGNHEEHLAA